MSYAEGTSVPVEKSRAEIEGLLRRYGAASFASGEMKGKAMLQFEVNERLVQFTLPLPDPNDARFTKTPKGRKSWKTDAAKANYDQEVRRLWRALGLIVKAKLEAVGSGILSFEEEFLSHFVMPDGKTVADTLVPMLATAYSTGKMPRLALPGVTK